jgi:prepilin-type processing-associated H-X9-DG protein
MNDFLSIDVGFGQETVLPLKDQDSPVTSGVRQVEWPKAYTATRASDKVVVTDLTHGYIIDWYYPNTIPNVDAPAYPWNNQIDWRRHASSKSRAGTVNVLYLDGHVSPAIQNPNGMNGHDQPNVVNDINGLDYTLGTAVNAKMKFQSQAY